MPTVAEWSRRTYPAPLGAGGVGSIPANSDAQNVPSFRRWRFEMKLSPFYGAYNISSFISMSDTSNLFNYCIAGPDHVAVT